MCTLSKLFTATCHIRKIFFILNAEVGTRYYFRSPLPLVRYLEIVLPLSAGSQL
jgi:hypothetical protein